MRSNDAWFSRSSLRTTDYALPPPLSDLKCVAFKGNVERLDDDRLVIPLLPHVPADPCLVPRRLRRGQGRVGVPGADVNREAGTHVERRVGLADVHRPRLLDEPKDRWHVA